MQEEDSPTIDLIDGVYYQLALRPNHLLSRIYLLYVIG